MLSKHTSSLKTYVYCVAGAHILLLTFFFPMFVLYTVALTLALVVSYVWVDLIHTIEEAHRMDILNLIYTSDCQETIHLLAYELYLHDENSLAGHRPFNTHGI